MIQVQPTITIYKYSLDNFHICEKSVWVAHSHHEPGFSTEFGRLYLPLSAVHINKKHNCLFISKKYMDKKLHEILPNKIVASVPKSDDVYTKDWYGKYLGKII